MDDKPAFEVRVGDPVSPDCKVYRIYASGRTEGFEDADKPVIITNRIPLIARQAAEKVVADLRQQFVDSMENPPSREELDLWFITERARAAGLGPYLPEAKSK